MITLENIVVKYKGGKEIGPITYELTAGKIIALVGENGAGKSTLMKCMMGQLAVTRGKISGIPKDPICYMPDELQFPVTLRVQEIIELLGSLKGESAEKQNEVIELVGLQEVRKKNVNQLSKGMRQRLNLAQSLLGETELFILDEPTNGLDPYWIHKLKSILQEEKGKGRLLLYSTHLLSTVEEIADEIIFIHEGKVIASGNVEELKRSYDERLLENLWMKLYANEERNGGK